ncbi:hypothetical protein D3C76_751450 [compost metagenome]
MAAEAVGEHGTDRVVVDIAAAIVGRAGVTQVGLQGLAGGHGQYVGQVDHVLVVEVVEVAVGVAGGEVAGPLVVQAGEIEAVAAHLAAGDALGAGAGDAHVLIVRGVALVDLGQPPGIHGQAFDFQRGQLTAFEGLRQQP